MIVSHCETEPNTPVVPSDRKIDSVIATPVCEHVAGSWWARATVALASSASPSVVAMSVR
jgi:hypothetical protein